MVPDDFTGYFAAAAAAGALIGLLFVAASLRPETVLGKDAPPAARAIAGSAFTALVNSFFVSLIALIPDTRLRLHRHRHGADKPLEHAAAARAGATAGRPRAAAHPRPGGLPGPAGRGLASIFSPDTSGYVEAVAYLLVASSAVALRRAWSLLQGRHLSVEQEVQPSD